MAQLHICQDDTGFWQLSFEDDDGTMTLISHQFTAPDHLIQDARDLVEQGKVPGVAIVIGPPRSSETRARGLSKPYCKPAPRKALD